MDQPGFFDVDERLARLSDVGDQLEAFSRAVDFEQFRPDLEKALAYADGSKAGRPPIDPVLMFKVLVIQTINTLSDERTEYLINDRLSFMRFLGLGLSDRVPDAKTIWLFRERLTKAGAIPALFERFAAMLRGAGYIAMSGQILDASLVAAPRQRNTSGEKADIKAGRVPEHWKDKPAKPSHKDRDARWTLKFTKAKSRDDGSMPAMDLAIPAFGYKSHISIDRRFRLIRRWKTPTPAPMMAPGYVRDCLIAATPAPLCGPIRRTDRRPTNASWSATASSRTSITRSRLIATCRPAPGDPMPGNQ